MLPRHIKFSPHNDTCGTTLSIQHTHYKLLPHPAFCDPDIMLQTICLSLLYRDSCLVSLRIVIQKGCPCLSSLQWCRMIASVQFSHSVVSDSLWPHELQHARPLCPSPAPGVHPNPCPLSQWCHPTISSSVVPFSFCPQFFPASGSFQVSQHFASGGQRIGVSASTLVLQWTSRTDLL